MSDFDRETARMLRLIKFAVDNPHADRSDISTVAARLKKMTGNDQSITNLAHYCADKALLWAYYGDQYGDEQSFITATTTLLRAINKT